jgi:small subunit ribosomal protein S8
MVMTDPIGDFLIRIKNGYLAGKRQVLVPYSRIKERLGQILVKEGYLENVKCQMSNVKFKILELELKYEKRRPVLTEVRRISKPGLRIYSPSSRIPRVRQGFGITIISTSKGLMTDKEAKKKNLGGEIICQVW